MTNSAFGKMFMSIGNAVLAQSAGAGALPTLYAATAPDVRGGDYIGPGGPFKMIGAPVKQQSNRASRDAASGEQALGHLGAADRRRLRAPAPGGAARRGVTARPSALSSLERRPVVEPSPSRVAEGARARAERLREVQEELAVVEDAERLHLERADAVLGRERAGGLLHRELVGLVGAARGLRVEDRVVVAAAQLEGDRAGDGRARPSA